MFVNVVRHLGVIVLAATAFTNASAATSPEILSLPTETQLQHAYGDSEATTPPRGLEFGCFVSPASRPDLKCFSADSMGGPDDHLRAFGVVAVLTEFAPTPTPGQWRLLTGRLHRERIQGAKGFRAWVEVISVASGEPFLTSSAPLIRARPPRGAPIQWALRPDVEPADVTNFGACLWSGLGPADQDLAKQELLRSGDRMRTLISVSVEVEDTWRSAWRHCYNSVDGYRRQDHVAPYFRYRASKELLLERGITEEELAASIRNLPFASLAATKLDLRLPEDSPVRARLWAPVFAALGLDQSATWRDGSPQALVLTYFQGLAELNRWVDDESNVSERGRDLADRLDEFDGPETTPAWVRKPTRSELAKFYPRLALAAGKPATATVACVIDADGVPATCRTISQTPEGDRESFLGSGNAAALAQCCYRIAPVRLGDPTSPTEGRPVIRFTIGWPFDPETQP